MTITTTILTITTSIVTTTTTILTSELDEMPGGGDAPPEVSDCFI